MLPCEHSWLVSMRPQTIPLPKIFSRRNRPRPRRVLHHGTACSSSSVHIALIVWHCEIRKGLASLPCKFSILLCSIHTIYTTSHRFREVHIADLIKAHEGNGDVKEEDPSKIHWGKFNMMGRFISNTLQCQAQCRNSTEYNYPERPYIAELFVRRPVMGDEVSVGIQPHAGHSHSIF